MDQSIVTSEDIGVNTILSKIFTGYSVIRCLTFHVVQLKHYV